MKSSEGTTKAGVAGLRGAQGATGSQEAGVPPARDSGRGCFIGSLGSGEVSCRSAATRRLTGEQPGGHCCSPDERNQDVDWQYRKKAGLDQ